MHYELTRSTTHQLCSRAYLCTGTPTRTRTQLGAFGALSVGPSSCRCNRAADSLSSANQSRNRRLADARCLEPSCWWQVLPRVHHTHQSPATAATCTHTVSLDQRSCSCSCFRVALPPRILVHPTASTTRDPHWCNDGPGWTLDDPGGTLELQAM